ncbi:membrane protein [Mycobacterium phage Fozzie]|uniref:Uncharacterized protein n=1 Tax=Mycobacterium phage AbsoluteMadLad TaxID=2593343 RepID=A0A514U095_9CAUD|nr:hypothetical protein SEA_ABSOLUTEMADLAD_58 [Mycobacterium phage AbsoluteMadLad]WNM70052.1 membrane protein [Mycobacterium phage Fozzie]
MIRARLVLFVSWLLVCGMASVAGHFEPVEEPLSVGCDASTDPYI